MKRIGIGIAAAAMAAAVMTPARAATVHVHIQGFAFSPSSISVLAGDTVSWDNHDPAFHTVTADSGLFDSDFLENGDSFSFAFGGSGTYAYHCNVHPSMRGTVSVLSQEPDLAITALTAPDAGPLAKTVTVQVKNQGLQAAAPFDVLAGYVYKDSFHAIGTISFPALAGAASQTRSIEWNTLGKLGTFTIRAVADVGGTVDEADETNNAAEGSTAVLVPGLPGVDLLDP